MVCSFCFCWAPYGIVSILYIVQEPGFISPVDVVIPLLMAKTCICIDPCVYLLANADVRMQKVTDDQLSSVIKFRKIHRQLWGRDRSRDVDVDALWKRIQTGHGQQHHQQLRKRRNSLPAAENLNNVKSKRQGNQEEREPLNFFELLGDLCREKNRLGRHQPRKKVSSHFHLVKKRSLNSTHEHTVQMVNSSDATKFVTPLDTALGFKWKPFPSSLQFSHSPLLTQVRTKASQLYYAHAPVRIGRGCWCGDPIDQKSPS